MKKVVFVGTLLLAAVIAGLVVRCSFQTAGSGRTSEEARTQGCAKVFNKARSPEDARRIPGVRTKPLHDSSVDDEKDDKRTPEERGLAADIEKALEEDDFELAKKCAPLALVCKDAEIRQSMVDTLSWFGEKAIPELTPFIADPDEDVAESAMSEWDSAVSSIDNEAEKIGMTEMAMQVISNEDNLESISGNYIGVDEKLAVESLLRIIEGGGSANGVVKAKETYEFITGEEFADRAAAEKWITEEYEPPEPGEE